MPWGDAGVRPVVSGEEYGIELARVTHLLVEVERVALGATWPHGRMVVADDEDPDFLICHRDQEASGGAAFARSHPPDADLRRRRLSTRPTFARPRLPHRQLNRSARTP